MLIESITLWKEASPCARARAPTASPPNAFSTANRILSRALLCEQIRGEPALRKYYFYIPRSLDNKLCASVLEFHRL